MSVERFLLITYCVILPLLIFFYIQLLRQWRGIWRSGGADVIGVLITLDVAILYAPASFVPIIRTPALHPHVLKVAGASLILGFILAAVSVIYGEQKLMQADEARIRAGYSHQTAIPVGPFVFIWGCTVLYIAAHLMFFLGDWS